jgi:hypothetical protein
VESAKDEEADSVAPLNNNVIIRAENGKEILVSEGALMSQNELDFIKSLHTRVTLQREEQVDPVPETIEVRQ